ncbi:ATP synthase subunit I [Paenibacillus cisolokensis]|jgi:ATP synthase protein I|uniref:ATP synthase I n=1 Tax=Paenibacillus cisolokensis TaxID=1658519 RepID=A0ABQ4N1B6_9BACL|nr:MULTISPECIES: ATP synthase subunit I [Paenibacillus]ALS26030.1 subunit I of F0F1 ATP synthase [Paenibacillus sp. 32O-W]GIQ61954.1 hypothetical protein PACILC2_05220 [Paenibacillus cisolokensis]
MDRLWNASLRVSYFFMALFLLLWGILPAWKPVFAGCMLGLGASVVNALLLRRRTEYIGYAAAGQGPVRRGVGLASRLATVLLAVMIAYRYPEKFDLVSTLSACFIMPFVILVTAYFQHKRDNSGKG